MTIPSVTTEPRFERWVKVSVGLIRFEPHMMPLVQQLGRLDSELVLADATWIQAIRQQNPTIEQSDAITGHIAQSYLWVLGAYELVRTLAQRMRELPEECPKVVLDAFQDAKKKFARLRMPLAKMEAASSYSDQDSHIAYPGIHQDFGIAWRLNPTTIISRRELSDAMLDALELARREKLRQQESLRP